MDYDTITVPAGERRVIRVGSGETFENKLIDITSQGSAASIIAQGTNWTVRNIAFKGEFSHKGRAFGVADTGGGSSKIENVYMGDGVDESVGETRYPQFGLWVSPEHNGRLDIERMYVKGAHDNAFYASAPGSNGNGQRGTVHFRNCRAEDSWVTSGYRISRGSVINCVGVNNSTGRNGRNLWVWPTDYHDDPVLVEGCDFIGGSYAHAYDFGRDGRTTEAVVKNTDYSPSGSTRFKGDVQLEEENVGHNPEDRFPEGCPDSIGAVFDADDGSFYDGRNPDGGENEVFDHSIEFSGTGAYVFEVEEGPIDDKAMYDTKTGGELDDETIVYEYDSYLCDVAVDGDVDVRINGEYEPTWSMYPTDASEGREWLEDAEWWDTSGDDGDDGEDDESGTEGPKIEDLLEKIDALEAENEMLRSEYDDISEAFEASDESIAETASRLQKLREAVKSLR